MEIASDGHQPGFRAWAILSSMVLAVLCLLGGACVLHGQWLVETYDADRKWGLVRGMRLGLLGIAVIWCGYMALLGIALVARRCRLWLWIVMCCWVLLAVWVLVGTIVGWYGTMFGGMRGVM